MSMETFRSSGTTRPEVVPSGRPKVDSVAPGAVGSRSADPTIKDGAQQAILAAQETARAAALEKQAGQQKAQAPTNLLQQLRPT
eukprot:3017103-Prymnesium_polylepis.1